MSSINGGLFGQVSGSGVWLCKCGRPSRGGSPSSKATWAVHVAILLALHDGSGLVDYKEAVFMDDREVIGRRIRVDVDICVQVRALCSRALIVAQRLVT